MHKTLTLRRFNGKTGDDEQMLTVFIYLGSRCFSYVVALDRRNWGIDSVESGMTNYDDDVVLSPNENIYAPPAIDSKYWCNRMREAVADLIETYSIDGDCSWMKTLDENDFTPDKWVTYKCGEVVNVD